MNIIFHIYKDTQEIASEAQFIIINDLNEIVAASDNKEFLQKQLEPDEMIYEKVTVYHPDKKLSATYWIESEMINDPEFKLLMYGTRGGLFYELKKKTTQYNNLFKSYLVLQAQFKKLSSELLLLKSTFKKKAQ